MFKVIYYSKNGKILIVDFLKTLPNKDQVKILREIDLLEQYGFSLGKPYIKKMKNSDGLWELRIKQSSNNYRVFYFSFTDNKFVLLHCFKKKTQKTPKKKIELALRRKQDFLERNDD